MTPGGRISLFNARTEVGASGRVGLLATENIKLLAGNPSGRSGLYALRNATWISQNKYPARNDYSTPDNVDARIVLAPGVTVYGNFSGGSHALFIGVGRNSNVTFDNYGTIQGASGAPNSGAGGNAIYAYCGDDTGVRHGNLSIRNYGSILPGGGGGGVGGVGGVGGGGYYVTWPQDGSQQFSVASSYWATWQGDGGWYESTRMLWGGTQVCYAAGQLNDVSYDGYRYFVGSYQYSTYGGWLDNGYGGGSDPGNNPPTCFPAGALVLMADGSQRAIETLAVGEEIMTVIGPRPIEAIDHPMLGTRRMLQFPDGHLWSEEHSHWTRDARGAQWLWSAAKDKWLAEVEGGFIGGLIDNDSIRTGPGYEFAHIDGWKADEPTEAPQYGPGTQLYFIETSGTLMIVNGYVVSAGVDQRRSDCALLDWDAAREEILASLGRALQPAEA